MEENMLKEKTIAADAANVKKGISGSTLKLIAVITMLIDHIGAAVMGRMVLIRNGATAENPWITSLVYDEYTIAYMVMRYIGRIAFPIYCFLLVEGFQRTHNKWKYAFRLGVFAMLSEIPFDLAFNSKVLEFEYQNVFLTLLFGLFAMIAVDFIERREWVAGNYLWNEAVKWILGILSVAVFAGVAKLMRTDYDAIGVGCIMLLYLFRKNKTTQIIVGCVSFLWELTAPLAFIPIAFYNGKRGLKLKYLFYVFYPLHLLILYLICHGMGIDWVPAV